MAAGIRNHVQAPERIKGLINGNFAAHATLGKIIVNVTQVAIVAGIILRGSVVGGLTFLAVTAAALLYQTERHASEGLLKEIGNLKDEAVLKYVTAVGEQPSLYFVIGHTLAEAIKKGQQKRA
jgi:hypothetical protein